MGSFDYFKKKPPVEILNCLVEEECSSKSLSGYFETVHGKQIQMPLFTMREALLCWTPNDSSHRLTAGLAFVCPWPDEKHLSIAYQCTVFACCEDVRLQSFEHNKCKVFIMAAQLMISWGVETKAVHQALLHFIEYRDGLAYDDSDAIEIPKGHELHYKRSGKRKRRRKLSKSKRAHIFQRDNFRCVYCGRSSSETQLVIDHIQPFILGGDESMSNLQTLCWDCNSSKRDNLF